jgi:hypothetical protein
VHESILELKVTAHTWPPSKPAALEFLQVVAAANFAKGSVKVTLIRGRSRAGVLKWEVTDAELFSFERKLFTVVLPGMSIINT